jgi:alkanesulfonate monooxygenase SsuD/methylene tetrahydromethanopterin reductase-like flavin-dependent oxidoreductase (luciferase family)
VKLSAFTIVDAYPPGVNGRRERFSEVLELAEGCEAAGLATLWIAEHHFHAGGTCPSPPVLLAAAGMRTMRIRLGVLVSVLPFHNPIEVAEQYAMVDQLVRGRFNFGAGSGYIALEMEGFGVDPTTKRERFDAALATILAGWHGEEIRVEGPHGGAVRLNVRPRQSPHPPLWVAVQRREAIPYVARRGTNIALVPYATVQSVEELGEEIREFRRHLSPGVTAEVAVALHLYAGPEPGEARAALQRYLDSRLATQSSFYQDKVRRDPHHASAHAIEASGFALFGSADDVVTKLEAFRRIGVDEILGIFDFGGLALEHVLGSVRALGPRVH